MRVSRTWFYVALVGSLAAAALWLAMARAHRPLPASKQESLAAHEQASYEVTVQLKQFKLGQGESLSLLLKGELSQVLLDSGALRSQWLRVDAFEMMGQDAMSSSQFLLAHPVFSIFDPKNTSLQHSTSNETPDVLQRLQANLLDKIILPITPGSRPELMGQRQELDDLGPYVASYQTEPSQGNIRVQKRWLSYKEATIRVDKGLDRFVYELSETGRLLQLDGQLGLDLPNARFQTEIVLRLKKSHIASNPGGSSAYSGLKTIVRSSTENPQPQAAIPYEASLRQLDALTEHAPGSEAYLIFTSLKQDLIANPDHGNELAARILLMTARDASTKRRVTLLFGALAQSESSRHADILADLARQCPDTFCKVQALAGVSDHKFPTESAAASVLEMARQRDDSEVQRTAILAAGSLGRTLESGLPQLSTLFSEQLADPALAEMKTTILAAMGNHGRADYLATLQDYAEAKNIHQRAAAVYSLRFIPDAESILLATLRPEQDNAVVNEAYKALAFRALSKSHCQILAENSLTIEDQDLQLMAARILLQAYQRDAHKAQESLDTFKTKSKFPAVRDYIASEIKPQEP